MTVHIEIPAGDRHQARIHHDKVRAPQRALERRGALNVADQQVGRALLMP